LPAFGERAGDWQNIYSIHTPEGAPSKLLLLGRGFCYFARGRDHHFAVTRKLRDMIASAKGPRNEDEVDMELKQFITEALTQIAEGIEDTQRHLQDRGSKAIVNTNMTATDVGHVVTGVGGVQWNL
jgi:hypothetical protein